MSWKFLDFVKFHIARKRYGIHMLFEWFSCSLNCNLNVHVMDVAYYPQIWRHKLSKFRIYLQLEAPKNYVISVPIIRHCYVSVTNGVHFQRWIIWIRSSYICWGFCNYKFISLHFCWWCCLTLLSLMLQALISVVGDLMSTTSTILVQCQGQNHSR